jgi:superfamily II RNA helicase
MTTEILRNLLYKEGTITQHLGITSSLSLQDLGAVVFDECHYINDRERGKVWEETMILLPPQVQLVLLSATLASPEKFASWLGEIKKVPVHLIQTTYRIVPLTHNVFYDGELQPIMDAKEVFYEKTYNTWLQKRKETAKAKVKYQEKVRDARAGGFEGAVDGKIAGDGYQHQLNQMVQYLKANDQLPAIGFVLSRRDCEKYAHKIEDNLLAIHGENGIGDGHGAQKIFDFHLRHHKQVLETLPQYHDLRNLITKGVAYHHSGLLPMLKEVIELLFSRGYIQILFCTETFAVGLNMPTKTVLFVGLTKYDDTVESMRMLRHDEYIQMAGRAGRRGKDTQGTVVYLPDREPPSLLEMRSMMKGEKPAIQSRMTFSYDFLLKTLHNKNTEWLSIMNDSYWYQQHKDAITSTQRDYDVAQTKVQSLQLLPHDQREFELKDKILSDISCLVNAGRKQAQTELNRWNDRHMGPKWSGLEKQWAEWKKAVKVRENCVRLLQNLENYTDSVQKTLKILTKHNYVVPNEENGYTVTAKGVLATECNENHLLYISEAYTQGLFQDLEADEILTILSCFGDDKESENYFLHNIKVSDRVRRVLETFETLASEYKKDEEYERIPSDPKFWKLCYNWVEPIQAWLKGAHAANVCSDYGIFEGNLVRMISKISNGLDELTAMATYSQDIPLLTKIEGIKPQLIRDVIQQDSLYLHL